MPTKKNARLAAAAVLLLGLALVVAADENEGRAAGPPGLLHWLEATAAPVAPSDELLFRGEQLYHQRCATCHGWEGRGDGPASLYLDTPPRDFTRGLYKFRTTVQDGMPADLDLFRSITAGFPTYGMPSFRYLSEGDRWALVHYLKTFYPDWDRFGAPQGIEVGAEPVLEGDPVARGRELYEGKYDCRQCHGEGGRGDGPKVPELEDYMKRHIDPRDFTLGAAYRKAGWLPSDTVRLLLTGVPGTPMPSQLDQLDDPADLSEMWAIAHHVEHLTQEAQRKRKGEE
ncbi:MAG: cytochrome c [Planctomycetes bacterium]|nr:cytochrome c [Planctomycetota bacterium]